jgi:phytoene dehydrogenase-like protein
VHLGGTLPEIAASERDAVAGRPPERPFVLLAQPSLDDVTRAPEGRHTAWAYCHVPNDWDGDATTAIEAQVERFAPGFRDVVLERRVHGPSELEAWDANVVGGDVNGGALTAKQWFGPRRWTPRPWSSPMPDLYMASAATPPGGGVHGMCGYHAARTALRESFGVRITRSPEASPVSGTAPWP